MSTQESIDLKQLNAFLKKNKAIDFRTADLLHSPNLKQYKWAGSESEKERLLDQLKAYQRMLRVVPSGREDIAKTLLQKGFQSSLQIASIPKKVFIQENIKLFDGDRTLAEQVYMRAIALRKAVVLQYMARVQQAEPHARVASIMP